MSKEELELQYKKKEWISIQIGAMAMAESKGEARGLVQGIELVAKNLLDAGVMSDEMIAQMTGLSPEQVLAIKNKGK